MTQKRTWVVVLLGSLLVVAVASEVLGGGGGWEELARRRREVLQKMVSEPEILINLKAEELPATSDMVRLGKKTTPAISHGLINNLDPAVRASCAAVLTATRDGRAIDPLIDALEDPDHRVASLALQALATVETRKPTAPLLAMLRRPGVPGYLKSEAVAALGRGGDPRAVPVVMAWFLETWDPAAQQALWDMRHQLSERQLELMVLKPLRAHGDKKPPPYEVLAFSVERAGDLKLEDAVGPLEELYQGQPSLQNRVIYNLGRIGEEDAVDFLEPLLDRTAEARQLNNITFALQRLGQDVRPFLRSALTDKRAYIRYNAAFVVGDLKEKDLLPELSQALGDVNDFVRGEAAVALGKVGDPAAIPALEAASREDNPVVRRDALHSLGLLDYPRFKQRVMDELISSQWRGHRARGLRLVIDQKDRGALPELMLRLNPHDHQDAQLGLEFLGLWEDVKEPDALVFLVQLTHDYAHRERALELLGRFGDPGTLPLVRAWARHPEGDIGPVLGSLARYRDAQSQELVKPWFEKESATRRRLYAAWYYASINQPQGRQVLLEALEDSPVEQKRLVARFLASLDLSQGELRPRLTKMLDHQDTYVRLYAAHVLAHHGDQEAVARLKRELDKKTPFIRDEVLDIVERLPPARREAVVKRWAPQAPPLLRGELERLL